MYFKSEFKKNVELTFYNMIKMENQYRGRSRN